MLNCTPSTEHRMFIEVWDTDNTARCLITAYDYKLGFYNTVVSDWSCDAVKTALQSPPLYEE
jgi:hypothetical protein